ncbi:hypothetical protein H5410_062090 [Solanum commersonii]|uniref:RanBP2-type domain-containing protein n=1 Tax=Solanum commersonii TaxID=4109 RepID=A0A9J5WAL8_SOLCO|nr:hypothetical protein H5410_062090 [Solanum commersonii]
MFVIFGLADPSAGLRGAVRGGCRFAYQLRTLRAVRPSYIVFLDLWYCLGEHFLVVESDLKCLLADTVIFEVNYGVDYDEDFYDYEDYNYDYDDGYEYAEKNGRAPETNTKQELVKVGIWRCSICTFDNRASMNVCDVCGNPKQEPVKAGVWCCPICTFDNEDTTNLCDMCGVLRNPLIKGCGGGGGKASAASLNLLHSHCRATQLHSSHI